MGHVKKHNRKLANGKTVTVEQHSRSSKEAPSSRLVNDPKLKARAEAGWEKHWEKMQQEAKEREAREVLLRKREQDYAKEILKKKYEDAIERATEAKTLAKQGKPIPETEQSLLRKKYDNSFDPTCSTCQMSGSGTPLHKPSQNCQSGQYAHCTCGTCY